MVKKSRNKNNMLIWKSHEIFPILSLSQQKSMPEANEMFNSFLHNHITFVCFSAVHFPIIAVIKIVVVVYKWNF